MKDTFFFSHDYNARNDPKMLTMAMKLGCEGIGIYWCIIEQLYEQGGKLENKQIETIAYNLHTTKTTVESVVFDFDLFVFDDMFFWSETALKRLENRKELSEKRSVSGKKGGAPKGNKNACVKKLKIENKQMVEDETIENKQMVEKNNQKQAIKEKERKENNNNKREGENAKRFTPPSVDEVRNYISEKNYSVDAESFVAFYTSKNWFVGKNKMRDWRSAVVTWEKRNDNKKSSTFNANDEWR